MITHPLDSIRPGFHLLQTWHRRLTTLTTLLLFGACAFIALPLSGTISPSIPSVAALAFIFGPKPGRVALLPDPTGPSAIALSPDEATLVVAGETSRSIFLFDTENLEMIREIDLPTENSGDPDRPISLAFSTDSSKLFIGTKDRFVKTGLICVLDIATGDILARLSTGSGVPAAFALTPDGKKLYAALVGIDAVAVFDTTTLSLNRTISVGIRPQAVAISPDGLWVLVANTGDLGGDFRAPSPGSTLTIIDAHLDEIATTLDVGPGPLFMTVTGDSKKAYAGNVSEGTVSVIDLERLLVTNSLKVGDSLNGMAFLSSRKQLFTSHAEGGVVRVIDTTDDVISATLALDGQPTALAAEAHGSRIFAALADQHRVAALNAQEVLGHIPVGDDPSAIVLEEQGPRGYVLAAGSSDVTVFNRESLQVETVAALALQPFAVAINPGGSRAYTTNFGHNTLSVIDVGTGTVTDMLRVGDGPASIAIDPNGNYAYIANFRESSVAVVDLALNQVVTVFDEIGGNNPIDVAVSRDGMHLFIANTDSGNLSVLDAVTGTLVETFELRNPGNIPVSLVLREDGSTLYVAAVDPFLANGFPRVSAAGISAFDITSNTLSDLTLPEDLLLLDITDLAAGRGPTSGRLFVAGSTAGVTGPGVNGISLVLDPDVPKVLQKFFTFDELGLVDPFELVLMPAGDRWLLLDSGFSINNWLIALDGPTGNFVYSRGFSTPLRGLAITPGGGQAYLTIPTEDSVLIVDPGTGTSLGTIPLPKVR